jgi:hypothetical protein
MGERIPMYTLALTFDQFAVLLDTGMPINEAFRRAAGVTDPDLIRISAYPIFGQAARYCAPHS